MSSEEFASYLERRVRQMARRPCPATIEEFESRRAEQRRELARCLGLDPEPERTPLNARITGTVYRSGFRIEKLVFESRPGFAVTAHLYLPEPTPDERLPVIVNPHGHWRHKKQETTVQSRLIFQALRGYLGVVVDSPGHSYEGDAQIERQSAGTHDDPRLTVAGVTATSVYVWDLVRLLDYLSTRPDTDMSRLGITGESGGGLATMYAFAYEPRFACAVPVVYASSYEINTNNGCYCNHVPGALRLGDRADVLAMRMPAPVYVIGASVDEEFPAEGTKLTGQKLKAVYNLAGAEEHVSCEVFDGPHDYSRPMREAAIGFFDKYLVGRGDGSPVPEPAFECLPAESADLICLRNPPAAEVSMRDVARSRLGSHCDRPVEVFSDLNGGRPTRASLDFQKEGEFSNRVVACAFASEEDLRIRGLLQIPERAASMHVVAVADEGVKKALLLAQPACFDRQAVILAIEARGTGKMRPEDMRLAIYTGCSIPFMAARDILSAAAVVRGEYGLQPSVRAWGLLSCMAALFAAVISSELTAELNSPMPSDFADALDERFPIEAIQFRAPSGPSLQSLIAAAGERVVFRGLG